MKKQLIIEVDVDEVFSRPKKIEGIPIYQFNSEFVGIVTEKLQQ